MAWKSNMPIVANTNMMQQVPQQDYMQPLMNMPRQQQQQHQQQQQQQASGNNPLPLMGKFMRRRYY
jgi:hypothetical protein